ncbi:hypothetical protein [Pararhodonellum marinum]|uniref:hypothetical protein n=1 Tax=Pararhodonellum marinum TaxID=2755358 RepID=UPI0018900EAA|nr:hypothetical protein [Pararhodonellum marinum]
MNAAILITAMMLFGGTQLPGDATTTNMISFEQTVQKKQDKDKKEIMADELPQAVRTSIAQHTEVRALPISKAWKMTKDDGKVYYKVDFGQGEETMSKKFNEDGTEVTD